MKIERDSRIQLFIEDSLEEGIEEEIIIQKLEKIFLVDQKQAKEYIDSIKIRDSCKVHTTISHYLCFIIFHIVTFIPKSL